MALSAHSSTEYPTARHGWKAEKLLATAVWLVPLVTYLGLPTREFYWDGVAFAIRIEKAAFDPRLLFHPNHLLYEAIGYKLFTLLRQAGLPVRALFLLQALNSLIASLCVLVLYLALRQTLRSPSRSLCLALMFAFSGTWWRFATDADAYIISILFLLLAYLRLTPSRDSQPLYAGLLHSCSMLFHELGVFFFPVVVVCLWRQRGRSPGRKLAGILEYTASAAIPTLSVYWYVFKQYANGVQPSSPGFLAWITDRSQDASFSFHPLRSAALTLLGTLRLFFTGQLRLGGAGLVELAGLILLAAVIASLIAGSWQLKPAATALWSHPIRVSLLGSHSLLVRPLLTWISAYVLFLFFWMPQNTFYRLFYLPPLILLAGVLWEDTLAAGGGSGGALPGQHLQGDAIEPQKSPGRYPALVVAAVFLWNFSFSVYPRSRPDNNPVLRFAGQQRTSWPPGTGIAFRQFDSDLWTICYFNPQASWIGLGPSDLATLDRYRQQLGRDGHALWIDGSAFDNLQSTAFGRDWLASRIDFSRSLDYRSSGRRFRFYRVADP